MTAKILYLLALALLLFALPEPRLIAALLALQFALWAVSRLPPRALVRATRRLWPFFLIIFISYAFTGGDADRWVTVPVGGWSPDLNLTGLSVAALMCVRVLTLVLASAWVQQSSAPGALVGGMTRLRVPESVAVTVDATLALLGGQGGQNGAGGGHGRGRSGERGRSDGEQTLGWRDVRRGRLDFITRLVERSLRRAHEWLGARYPELGAERLHDLTIIVAVSLAVMGLKVLQVLPGVPIASGHKNLLIVPLLLLASYATHMRFGGFAAGTTVGIVSFMLGYGKYGVLEIAHFAVPGLLADILMPFARASGRLGRLAQFAAIGVVLGLGRFAANFLVIVLAGAPQVAFFLFAPMLASQVIFGALSCFVSIFIVRKTSLGMNDG